ncbi:MAG: VapC toxin family PIN domain ribonuclease [Acidobacteria bacterium]|nr:MAG: VapC toxin family PIN domain ribonuclease [Acidobacteriota bacterium]
MRALLDINVVIALLDPDHAVHERAHAWWAGNASRGWASCPITENGVVRVMSSLAYSRSARFTPAELIVRLRTFAASTDHQFWPDDVSVRDPAVFGADRIHGSRQLTDLYLLATSPSSEYPSLQASGSGLQASGLTAERCSIGRDCCRLGQA